jgi:transaldolase
VDGVTTNPSLAAKTGRDYVEVLKEICGIVPGAVSAEVLATDYDGMLKQAKVFLGIAKNIAIKVPLTWDGLKACKTLSDGGTMVNVTLCFSPVQALAAAKAGAHFISPFIGRVDDIGEDGTCANARWQAPMWRRFPPIFSRSC